MDYEQLIDKWTPVINTVMMKRFEHRTRPWTDEKKIFIARKCEEFGYASSPQQDTFLPTNHQIIFAEYINKAIIEYDSMDSTGDDECMMNTIINEIQNELQYATDKWGIDFDDRNSINDWVTFINIYASKAARMDSPPSVQKACLVKTAGLAISALKALERNGMFSPRHYEAKVSKD